MITIVEPKLLWSDLSLDIMDKIPAHLEWCGRNCYKSEDKIKVGSSEKFLRNICSRGHESVLEHVTLTAKLILSRAASHQLVRHRIGAYCLSGDTEIVAFTDVKSRSPKRWTLKQLYDWSLDPKRKGRLKLIRLRSLDKEGRLVPGKIRKVFDSGEQEVFEIKTKFGRSIKATTKHRFLTGKGWKPLSEIRVGDNLFSNGTPAYKNPEWIKEQYLKANRTRKETAALAGVSDVCLGVWIRKFGLQKPCSDRPNKRPGRGVKGMHTEEGKRQISNRMKGEKNHRWKGSKASVNAGRLRAQKTFNTPDECETCGSANRLVRHHIDGDTHNNIEENIVFLCECCHHQWHVGQAVMSVFKDEVISISPSGVEHTYDIEMDGPNHNFVANGLVVHNSQESMRYCNYGKKGLKVVCPPTIGLPPGEYTIAQHTCEELCEKYRWMNPCQLRWLTTVEMCYQEYLQELKEGVKPEDARFTLPNATKTEVVTTYNISMWRHVIRERALNERAQWEIRKVITEGFEFLKLKLPSIFGDLK